MEISLAETTHIDPIQAYDCMMSYPPYGRVGRTVVVHNFALAHRIWEYKLNGSLHLPLPNLRLSAKQLGVLREQERHKWGSGGWRYGIEPFSSTPAPHQHASHPFPSFPPLPKPLRFSRPYVSCLLVATCHAHKMALATRNAPLASAQVTMSCSSMRCPRMATMSPTPQRHVRDSSATPSGGRG